MINASKLGTSRITLSSNQNKIKNRRLYLFSDGKKLTRRALIDSNITSAISIDVSNPKIGKSGVMNIKNTPAIANAMPHLK